MRKKEKKMLWKPPFIFFLPVIEMLVIGYITGNFFSLNDILDIIYSFCRLGLVVIGMSFVILSGGIDFSAGGQMALSGMLMAILIVQCRIPYAASFFITMAAGMFLGYLNGSISMDFGIEPSLETFGMMIILNGLVYTISGGHSVMRDVKEFQFWTGTASRMFPIAFLTLFLTWVTGKLLLEKTYPGRFLRAVGENPETAEFIGRNSRTIKIFAYMICSFMMTVTAAFMICYNHAATPFSGSEYMSDSLIACCAGGFSLRGGNGRLEEALAAALALVIFDDGIRTLGASQGITGFIKAVMLLIVLVINFKDKLQEM